MVRKVRVRQSGLKQFSIGGGGFKVFDDTVLAFILSGISVFGEKLYGISVFKTLPVTVN